MNLLPKKNKKNKTIEEIDDSTWSVTEDVESNTSKVYSYTGDTVTYTVNDNEPKVNQYAEDALLAFIEAAKNDKDYATRFLGFIEKLKEVVEGDALQKLEE